MKKLTAKKLKLDLNKVRSLTADRMVAVAGGAPPTDCCSDRDTANCGSKFC